ncbi:chorismate lyase [Polynucleobacter sp. MWH-Svant-W18]|jgi:chorismate--pyruvate lyase|uniref:chorismate--pyruvate lyase family protein n=1 Tax=Polynucleobacter sp. MWH-Svant-W18 TaxID=1855909 RepID=UPI001BFE3D40|nr:chorismate lyase [Polynucleobacter sp. MWH-Svant-W18]QWD77459.1 chorismate lyase [Polynucleobacter sp. MWH-Svant-W18]
MFHRNRLRSAWNRVGSGEIHRAPRQWQAWLSDTGSLTQKIEKAIGQKLEVQVLRDCPQTLNSDESRYFHFRIRRCRVREVLLCANGIPLVMAHSVIPTFSSSGSNHAVLRLGKKPLGAVLFAKTRKHSKAKPPRDIARLDKNSALWKRCFKNHPKITSPLWARRTLYRLKGHPILVNEIFLPALLQQTKA